MRPRARLFLGDAMHHRTEGDRLLDGETRVERGVAVLKYHLHAAAQLAQRQIATELFAIEHD